MLFYRLARAPKVMLQARSGEGQEKWFWLCSFLSQVLWVLSFACSFSMSWPFPQLKLPHSSASLFYPGISAIRFHWPSFPYHVHTDQELREQGRLHLFIRMWKQNLLHTRVITEYSVCFQQLFLSKRWLKSVKADIFQKSISVLLKQFLEKEILAVKTFSVIIPESQI